MSGSSLADRGAGAARAVRAAHCTIDSVKRLVLVRFGKKVTIEDISRYSRGLTSHPSFEPTFSEIIDLREVEELNLQAADFLKLADQIDPFLPQAKRAFVVRTQIQKHAARMHKVLRTNRNIEVFECVTDAERWIDGVR